MKSTFLILLFFTFGICNSQNERQKRTPFKLNLPVDTEHYYAMDVEETPFLVKENVVQIYPGEKVFLETEIKGDTIYSMKSVEKNLYPEKTIEVEFSQEAKDKSNISMFLNVKNPFDKTLYHDALMYTATGQKWQRTSIIPIRAKLQNFETWGYTIITLVLDHWRFKK
jgi:hypothetical protein